MNVHSPIAVLDSGVGGLTVLRALREQMPREDFLYFGDTGRMPYGGKAAGAVAGYVEEIVGFLQSWKPKQVVLACNTATAAALGSARAAFPGLEISGVIDPGAAAAEAALLDLWWAGQLVEQEAVVGVLATEATVRSGAYERAIRRRNPSARVVSVAATLLASLIEEGRDEHDPLARVAVEGYVMPLVEAGARVLVLGCTHYPLLRKLIERVVGSGVRVVDGASACGQDVRRRLSTVGLLRGEDAGVGSLRCWVTDDSARFARLASRFLGYDIPRPEVVQLEQLAACVPATCVPADRARRWAV